MTFSVSRSCLRISLAGGASDLPAYYERAGSGQVISFGIDKYLHVASNKVNSQTLKLMYSKIETVNSIQELKHDIVKEIWKYFKFGYGWEIGSFGDLPTFGTGLGGSSAFTAALIHNLLTYHQVKLSKADLAELVCAIEMKLCKSPIGKQDQYATVFGGLNHFVFKSDGTVTREKLKVTSSEFNDFLDEYCLLFYTGLTHNTNNILEKQKIDEDKNFQIISVLESYVPIIKEDLLKLDGFAVGSMLDETWQYKRQLPGTTLPYIDEIYETAYQCGAWGGKLLGAGAGGHILILAPPQYHKPIEEALYLLKRVHFHLDTKGTTNVV